MSTDNMGFLWSNDKNYRYRSVFIKYPLYLFHCFKTHEAKVAFLLRRLNLSFNFPETKGKKKGGDEEEDTGPNTYDYNDSFINDESQGKEEEEEESGKSEEEDGSEEGSEEEDIAKLKKEAKSFIKNKKMTKPVWR